MLSLAKELEALLEEHFRSLLDLSEEFMSFKPAPSKWSKKEILGHLVDSAQSNIRRLVVVQYEEVPHIVYNQDKWNSINGYQQWPTADIIQLLYQLNKQFCQILKRMPAEMKDRLCRTEDVHTIEWLAGDYLKHLRHHLYQVLDLEPVAYP